MKKLLAIVLAVLSAFSMTAVAYADNTTTLTTTVPDATYTLNIPANQEITFGDTSPKLGTVTVTDAAGFAVGKDLKVTCTFDPFSSPDTSTVIPFSLVAYYNNMSVDVNYHFVTMDSGSSLVFKGNARGGVDTPKYLGDELLQSLSLSIESSAWGKALGGEYSATITFSTEVVVED
ncbi:MAG: hypothetical protein IKU32_00615 [Clostridia bacterium]|nr:hypothetical protein [Clostridia bacterium]